VAAGGDDNFLKIVIARGLRRGHCRCHAKGLQRQRSASTQKPSLEGLIPFHYFNSPLVFAHVESRALRAAQPRFGRFDKPNND
jgi:hypothetical protein